SYCSFDKMRISGGGLTATDNCFILIMLSISYITKNMKENDILYMERPKTASSISSVIVEYLDVVKLARSQNTALTYAKALKEFKKVLVKIDMDPETSHAGALTEDHISRFVMHLKAFAPATEQLYVRAIARFYKYLAAERLAEINLPRMDLLIEQRTRKPGIRLPQFPTNDIERVLEFVSAAASLSTDSEPERLRAMRDRALLLTLADTGLRIHEACNLRRGDIDWNEGRAIIIGKGDKQAVVRFTTRAMRALKDYLLLRAELDGGSGKQLTALPLFARHDKGTGKKIKPITPTTGRNIVAERVKQALGSEAEGHITPHSFRHYFVSTILRASGNLKLAQALARHENIQITQRYAHIDDDELDKGYFEIFEKKR
ncbi:MAG: tyrosine-type recombinase/integrase, partial [Chloroflexota bacterium]|nr:tyrosine-type recombinase/integrase [Chloroflexota bacterium]